MIVVTGTKRSGTSMWMQLLKAAGFPPIGAAFPRDWEATIKDANPAGFWESELRRGIYYRTNPDPKTGTYLFPEQTRHHAVKVFIPGLIRTDRAFMDRVIATIRPWRQYVRSLSRLYAMEREARNVKHGETQPTLPPSVQMPPAIEWWTENFSLVSDIVTRRYPFYTVAYDSVFESTEETLRDVFGWLGGGDVDSAMDAVEPALRTQNENGDDEMCTGELDFEPEIVEVFDALYDVVRDRCPLEQSFVDTLNATNDRLSERIEKAVRSVARRQLRRQQSLRQQRQKALDPAS